MFHSYAELSTYLVTLLTTDGRAVDGERRAPSTIKQLGFITSTPTKSVLQLVAIRQELIFKNRPIAAIFVKKGSDLKYIFFQNIPLLGTFGPKYAARGKERHF